MSVFLWIASSCNYAATQTVIEIQADAVVRQRATEIRIEVTDSIGNALRAPILVNPRSGDFVGFPLRLPISARRGDDARSFGVRISAVETIPAADGSVNVSTLASNQIRTGFARARILRATLWLLSGCRCLDGERCVPDENNDRVPECKPIDVDVLTESNANGDAQIDASLDASVDGAVDSMVVHTDTCSATQHLCEGRCVSNFSPSYCGATSCTACPVPEHAIDATCGANGCGFVCDANYSECQGACVNAASDRLHCNGCGNACPGAQLCVNRQCVEPPQCTSEAGCQVAGTYCNSSSGRCESGCNDASDCSAASEICNPQTHRCDCAPTHHRCAQTGNACVPLTQIDACGVGCSTCTAPSGGTATCNGACAFVCSSGMRCGAACSLCPTGANIARSGCMGDACVVFTCAAGFVRNTDNSACVPAMLRWVERGPARSPSPRRGAAMAYDSERQRMVLFGGFNDGIRFDDTWEWNGSTWTEITTSNPPLARSGHAMVYDSMRRKVLLFGGFSAAANLRDTWEWNGSAWSEIDVDGPPGRGDHALAYDSSRQRAVMFGGRTSVYFGDRWEWNGSSWSPIHAGSAPSARGSHAMAYDAARQRVVLFGGEIAAASYLNDTWEWTPAGVTPITTTNPPPARRSHAMTYDSHRQRVILYGGYAGYYLNDTWEWNGSDWSRLSIFSPSARYDHAMAYDSARQCVVVFGGIDSSYTRNDTWELGVP